MESLYVCLFSNGHIKVGRSVDPASRIANHADRVACMGVTLVDSYVVACVDDGEREQSLINACVQKASQRYLLEWFVGLDFAEVCKEAFAAAREAGQIANTVRTVRLMLGVTQEQLAAALDCTQGNIGFIERGRQPLVPERAIRLADYADSQGLRLTLDQIYGREPLPPADRIARASSTVQSGA